MTVGDPVYDTDETLNIQYEQLTKRVRELPGGGDLADDLDRFYAKHFPRLPQVVAGNATSEGSGRPVTPDHVGIEWDEVSTLVRALSLGGLENRSYALSILHAATMPDER